MMIRKNLDTILVLLVLTSRMKLLMLWDKKEDKVVDVIKEVVEETEEVEEMIEDLEDKVRIEEIVMIEDLEEKIE